MMEPRLKGLRCPAQRFLWCICTLCVTVLAERPAVESETSLEVEANQPQVGGALVLPQASPSTSSESAAPEVSQDSTDFGPGPSASELSKASTASVLGPGSLQDSIAASPEAETVAASAKLDLCADSVVDETCELIGGSGRQGTVTLRELQEFLSADVYSMQEIWETLNIESEEGDMDYLDDGDSVSCKTLCNRVTDYIKSRADKGETILPDANDAICYTSDKTTMCDSSLADEEKFIVHEIATDDHELKDQRGGRPFVAHEYDSDYKDDSEDDGNTGDGIETADGSAPFDGKKEDDEEDDINFINHEDWELVERIANLFQIYPSLSPNRDDESSEDMPGSPDNSSSPKARSMSQAGWLTKTQKSVSMSKVILSQTIRQLHNSQIEEHINRWFGRSAFISLSTRREIQRVLNAIQHTLSNIELVYPGNLCTNSTFAYALPKYKFCTTSGEEKETPCTKNHKGKYVLYLCDVFVQGSSTDMIETIIREGSHHATSYTDDVCLQGTGAHCEVMAYGRSNCRELASRYPNRALQNAASFCYYVADVGSKVNGPSPVRKEAALLTPNHTSIPRTPAECIPNEFGDCTCPQHTQCKDGERDFCPYAGKKNGGRSLEHYASSCKSCHCVDFSKLECKHGGTLEGADHCKCPSHAKYCFQLGASGCKTGQGDDRAEHIYKKDCRSCRCRPTKAGGPSVAIQGSSTSSKERSSARLTAVPMVLLFVILAAVAVPCA